MDTALIDTPLFSIGETLERRGPGETLFSEGEWPVGVYILHSGRIDLMFSARNGFVRPLRTAGEGQILGLSAVVMQKPHDCSAMTRTNCEIGFIERERFLSMLGENPSIWFRVLQLLSNDVNAVYDAMRSLATGDVRHLRD